MITSCTENTQCPDNGVLKLIWMEEMKFVALRKEDEENAENVENIENISTQKAEER